MHQSSGNWKLGLILSLITAVLWGVLPLALKALLESMNSVTITWYRFVVSLGVIAVVLYKRNRIPDFRWTKNKTLMPLFVIAIVGLCGNYILYLIGLDFVTPSAAQIFIQLAPLFLLFGGIAIFNESFSLKQWLGVVIFISGLLLFFHHRLNNLLNTDGNYFWGMVYIIAAAVTWAGYALAQKQLLKQYGSQQIMFIIYVFASVFFLLGSSPGAIFTLDQTELGLLFFCCLNTLLAYGSFAEALAHWDASRVSAVLATTPLFTIAFGKITNYYLPGFIDFEPLDELSLVGATALVIGSAITALSKKKSA